MGPAYSGILGCIAFFATMARGVLHGSGPESVVPSAIMSLFGFALIGYLCGVIAGEILNDSVQAQVASELAAEQAQQNNPVPKAKT